MRVQVLSRDIVRIEYDDQCTFEDSPTFLVPNRNFDDAEAATVEESPTEYVVSVSGIRVVLNRNAAGLEGIRVYDGDQLKYRFRHLRNTGELPSIGKTPFVFPLLDAPRIVCPSEGYSAESARNGHAYTINESAKDLYLLLCRNDARKLRSLYVQLTGRNEMVRLSTFGMWNSRYYPYSQQEALDMIAQYRVKDVPLDNMVIDTDWRAASDRGIGYDVNTKLFPDLRAFFTETHRNHVEIMFNDHPEPLEGAQSLLSDAEIAYREEKLQTLLSLGLDMWWYDRNWKTALCSPTKGILPETWGMYLYTEITKHYYQRLSGNNAVYRRPVIMGNVNDICNGTYRKINDSASHRYSIQWTGDIGCQDADLLQEIQNLIRASDNCIAYVNCDCGGHAGDPDKELYIRWMKFGAFLPVLRPHCNNAVKRYREPWNYDEETLSIVREYVKMRYRLLPLMYRCAYDNYLTGEPICKSMGLCYPTDSRALHSRTQYLFGDDILVAPIYGEPLKIVPKRYFTTPVTATYYDGCSLQGNPIAHKRYTDINQVYDKTAPVKGMSPVNYSAVFEFGVKFTADTEIFICNDDGTRFYLDGKLVLDDWKCHYAFPQYVATVRGGEPHHVRMEYMQAGNQAVVKLMYKKAVAASATEQYTRKHSFYIPAGTYMHVFSGKKYTRPGRYSANFGLRDYPIFVRCGSVIPLAKNAHNTTEQRWDELAFDVYPSAEANYRSYLYEDDTQTTAYKHGEYRVQPFGMFYHPQSRSVVVWLDRANGNFAGEKCFADRTITVRYHIDAMPSAIKSVKVNGKSAEYRILRRDAEAYPFGFDTAAPDGDICTVTVKTSVSDTLRVEFLLVRGEPHNEE